MWYNKYIGLPYQANGRTTSGIDCWGLAVLIYRDEFNIELPSFTENYFSSDNTSISNLVNQTRENWLFTKESWRTASDPKSGDICVFKILGEPTHVGIYIGNRKFLHVREGLDSVIESLDSHAWNRRLEGIYTYTTNSNIQLTGTPHPLQTQLVTTSWQIPGQTIDDIAKYISNKYSISKRLMNYTVITVDGTPIPTELWATTKVRAGQVVNYRIVPTGGPTTRMILTFVVAVAVVVATGGTGAGSLSAFIGETLGVSATTGSSILFAATTIATSVLINAIAPIRPPDSNFKDPGQYAALNLFNGSSNQANRFGPIPVVLGRVRMAAMLGAQPYIESRLDTSIINLLLVWGFGPLDISNYQVGLTPIEEYYNNNTKDDGVNQLAPTTVYGLGPNEDQTLINNIYGRDVTQIIPQRLLVNELGTQTNNWSDFTLSDDCTRIDISFNFPVGMRAVGKAQNNAGQISNTSAEVEIQYKVAGAGSWTTVAHNNIEQNSLYLLDPMFSSSVTIDSQSDDNVYVNYDGVAISSRTSVKPRLSSPESYYRWYSIAMSAGNGIKVYAGAPTTSTTAQPDPEVVDAINLGSLSSLVDKTAQYSRLPVIPDGWTEIYRMCLSGGNGLQNISSVDRDISPIMYSGSNYIKDLRPLTQSTSTNAGSFTVGQIYKINTPGTTSFTSIGALNNTAGTIFRATGAGSGTGTAYLMTAQYTGLEITPYSYSSSTDIRVTIAPGNLTGTGASYTINQETNLFTTQIGGGIASQTGAGQYVITGKKNTSVWCQFLQDYAMWISSNSNATAPVESWTHTQTFTVVKAGVHKIYMSADNTAQLYIDSLLVISLDDEYSFKNVFTQEIYLEAGTRTIVLKGQSGVGSNDWYGVGVRITYTESAYAPAADISLKWGESNFTSRKDAFNDTFTLWNLPKNRYSIRVRRKDDSRDDRGDGWQQYNQVVLFSITGFGNADEDPPTINPKGCYLAKTAIRLQSSNKVNGNIDGVNALVTTKCYDWNGTSWMPGMATNNPASLFRYVLTHPANMYAIAEADVSTYIDLTQLQSWHTFCSTKNLTYNSVVTSTKSVMDVLREICAAGLASPSMVNGKWTVVIDRPRSNITQHFTPHNSWDFQSTKVLPRIPDAFRITIPDETQAYQPYEMLVYAPNKTVADTKIYEEISLPGVTNQQQAIFLAKWHYAQLKLRPEIYTLNVDFEYLVCTRGDLVRVSHDVPMWGIGTGRIKSVSSNTITLAEEVVLQSGKTYTIRIRSTTNTSPYYTTSTNTFTVSNASTPIYFTTITVNGTLDSNVKANDLFMIGEQNTESQELVVLSIEPTSNTSAKLTLTDYSPSIYNEDFNNLVYLPNITGRNSPVILNTINNVPIISTVTSDSEQAEQSTGGTYVNILRIGITHPDGLVAIAEQMHLQIVESNASMPQDATNLIKVNKSGNITVENLTSLTGYKFRVRYANTVGTICGPWSDVYFTTHQGKITNTMTLPNISVSLDDHYLVVTPANKVSVLDPTFFAFEYRVYKNSGDTAVDFWDTVATTNIDLKIVQSTDDGRIDLLGFSTPRISEAGVQYRVACRIVDQTNNYTTYSTLASFTLKTIVEENPED